MSDDYCDVYGYEDHYEPPTLKSYLSNWRRYPLWMLKRHTIFKLRDHVRPIRWHYYLKLNWHSERDVWLRFLPMELSHWLLSLSIQLAPNSQQNSITHLSRWLFRFGFLGSKRKE